MNTPRLVRCCLSLMVMGCSAAVVAGSAMVACSSNEGSSGSSSGGSTDSGGATCAVNSDLIDDMSKKRIDGPGLSGYWFTYTPGAAAGGTVNTYTLSAQPVAAGTTGQRGFFTDESGVIRYSISGAAALASSPLQ